MPSRRWNQRSSSTKLFSPLSSSNLRREKERERERERERSRSHLFHYAHLLHVVYIADASSAGDQRLYFNTRAAAAAAAAAAVTSVTSVVRRRSRSVSGASYPAILKKPAIFRRGSLAIPSYRAVKTALFVPPRRCTWRRRYFLSQPKPSSIGLNCHTDACVSCKPQHSSWTKGLPLASMAAASMAAGK